MIVLYVAFEVYRLALRSVVLVMAAHHFASAIGYLRRRAPPTPADPVRWPFVTVQIPIRNEYYTAARAIEAIGALDYPRDRIEVQVLDDSDDATVGVAAAAVSRVRESGVAVEHLRRDVPAGYKAGALAAALSSARGEVVAMFDADFVPPSDFLKRTVPWFADPRVGLVQGAWHHENREESFLTRIQGQIIDGLMLVEQAAKSHAGAPLQFNGTAGVWRRTAIDAAGGWTFDSLTEDLDLSIRAQLAGWRFVHLPDLRVPSQLPSSMAAFRVQQRRWALGTSQLLRKRALAVLRAEVPLRVRLGILVQLCRHLVAPLVLLMVASVPATTLAWWAPLVEYEMLNAVVLGLLVAGIAAVQVLGAVAARQSVLRALVYAPLTVPLGIGLSATYTVAIWYGLRDRAGPFFRTPKHGQRPLEAEPTYRPRRSWLIVAEVATGLAYAWPTAIAVDRGLYVGAAFMCLVAAGFLWLGLGSIRTATTAWTGLHHGAGAPESTALAASVERTR